MGDGTGRPLDALAAQLKALRFKAVPDGETLVVSPPWSLREWVIACDGRWFRWDGPRGPVVGLAGDAATAADVVASVLRHASRWA